MNPRIHSAVVQRLDPTRAYAFVDDPAHGAVTAFIGVVRNHHNGQSVSSITYDVHEPLALQTFNDICTEALNFWDDVHIFIEHAKGRLSVGDISIVIAVSSPHRAATFEACRFVIEETKKRAAIWKHEQYTDGAGAWLPGQRIHQESKDSCGGGGCGGGCGCA